MNQNVLLKIRGKLADLPKSEQKIGDFILKHPSEVIQMNASKLAKEADSSPAGVIRFCHSIGLSGFTDLKISLSAESKQWSEDHYTDILPDESLDKIKKKLAVNTGVVLDETNDTMENKIIEQAVNQLVKSPIIFVYGLGASYIVAMDFKQKFTRIGKQVVVTQDQHELAAAIAIAPAGSVYLGISNSGEKKEGLVMMEIAKEWGLTTISLTRASENPLSLIADIVLKTAETNEALLRSGATISLLSQLYAVDILFFHFMTKDYDRNVHNLELSRKATDTFQDK